MARLVNGLPPEHLAAIQRPIQLAATPPSGWYTSREWYDREVERIFMREWLCVGRTDQIANVGDYFTIDLVGEPLLVARDEAGDVRAYVNVCRHRGMVVMSGSGNCKAFQCPYHNWTYALSGALRGTPGRPRPMDDAQNFDRADYGLVPVRIESLAGFLFVNFDGQAPPLGSWAGDLGARLAPYDLEAMCGVRDVAWDVACNWKVLVENLEGYHVATLHGAHLDPSRPPQIWTHDETHGPYEAMRGIGSLQAGTLPVIEGLGQDAREAVYHLWVQPNLQIVLTASHMQYRLFVPDGPERSRWIMYWYVPRSTASRPDFDERMADFYAKTDPILDEDAKVGPEIQRGVRSRFHQPGRYSPQEHIPYRFANYVLKRVLPAEA
jgi:choline monooxygenase